MKNIILFQNINVSELFGEYQILLTLVSFSFQAFSISVNENIVITTTDRREIDSDIYSK